MKEIIQIIKDYLELIQKNKNELFKSKDQFSVLIITGRGKHSKNNISVNKESTKKYLLENNISFT